jgi:YHS domain-containing protein
MWVMIRSAIAFVILGAGVSFGFLDEKSSSGPTIVQVVVGLDGFCPVSYQTEHKAVLGSPNYASEYAGYTYFLASEEAKKKFDADPSRYAPRIGGLCTVALGGPYGNRFWGDPRVFAVVNDRLYLLSSQRAKLSFDKKPLEYIAKAEELYRQPWLKGMCPVSYKLEGKPVEGKSEFQQEFRGHI